MLTAYFDGSCPCCTHSMLALQRRAPTGIRLVDAAAADFDPASIGRTRLALMTELCVQRMDGTHLNGVDAVHALFGAAGLAWLAWPLRIRPLRRMWMAAYAALVRNRYAISSALKLDCSGGTCTVRYLGKASWRDES
ncbi:hypothetical protein IGB42_00060 [Andreprevotia sp. IGB-42]|uniref:DCC1-like thiol-disulfide oxidoreductase family protein n=1 Tax=Andreprevotia sp. IGB-42 TaxID=2497473 RepID=UPI00135B73EE|nr:DCC1-like thiol-disulfide oxidoreductase family protein [Andreprevotia sp. IGB-42]KAF0814984.1 hypothetical protein IGB42_00060 [Andreprevotia sp. IGB-42]